MFLSSNLFSVLCDIWSTMWKFKSPYNRRKKVQVLTLLPYSKIKYPCLQGWLKLSWILSHEKNENTLQQVWLTHTALLLIEYLWTPVFLFLNFTVKKAWIAAAWFPHRIQHASDRVIVKRENSCHSHQTCLWAFWLYSAVCGSVALYCCTEGCF